ncbi:MAG: tRNA pseudouridine(54/55) synthase Pus10 [Candidatus Asgardarchaeia archaeon]
MEGTCELIGKSLKVILRYPLCDWCLGRLFGALSKGVENDVRGSSIKLILSMEAHKLILRDHEKDLAFEILRKLSLTGFEQARALLESYGEAPPEKERCFICDGLFEKVDEVVAKVLKKLDGIEYETFLVGCILPSTFIAREDKIKSEFEIPWAESIKHAFNRVLGKELSKLTGKRAEFEDPDLTIVYNLLKDEVEIRIRSIFIYGRYLKLMRGIPQSKWRRRYYKRMREMGMEVEEKSYYPTSVEEMVSKQALKVFEGEEGILHAAGREDIDARMLGNGRPFVLEVKNPKRRSFPLKELENMINEYCKGVVQVKSLRYVDRSMVSKIKLLGQRSTKKYRALVECDEKVSDEELEKLCEYFNEIKISQRTPLRVSHRRADKVRYKKVYKLYSKRINDKKFELIIESQGGLYIKELISGDEGRTRPSVSEFLGKSCRCLELDVIGIFCEGLEDEEE